MSEPRDTNPRPSSGQPRAHMGWTVVAVAAIVVIATQDLEHDGLQPDGK